MSSDATRPYFVAMNEFNSAASNREYRQALHHLREGLRVSQRALDSLNDQFGHPASIPFIESKAGAIAALFDDTETFDLMQAVANHISRDADIDEYRADALAMAYVRQSIARSSSVSLASLRAGVDPRVRSHLSRLVSWMEKNRELAIIKDGKNVTVESELAGFKPSVTFPTFRQDSALAQPKTRPLRPIKRPDIEHDERRKEREERLGRKTYGTIEEHFLAPDLRTTGVMNTTLLRDGIWLIGRSRSNVDNSSYTSVLAKTHDGAITAAFDLDHRVVHVYGGFERSHVVVLDSILGVHVYDFYGNQLQGFSLAKNPEFLSVYELLDDYTKATALVRAVDVSSRTGEIMFSVLDRVWRFTADVTLLSALFLPPGDPVDTSTAVAIRVGSELAVREKNAIDWGTDWIYFARFSDFDDSAFVSLYSGHFLKLSPAGEVRQAWRLEGATVDVIEDVDHTLVTTYGGLYLLHVDGKVEHFEGTGTLLMPSVVIGKGKREVSIFDVASRSTTYFALKRDLRAVYPIGRMLRIETSTTFAEIALD